MRSKKTLAIRTLIIETKRRPCTDCGAEYPWYVMDFDHVRGEKRFNLSAAANRNYGLATVQAEIDKCEVVCSNCHRQRTQTRWNESHAKHPSEA